MRNSGRPQAVASLYRYKRDGFLVEDHEFQSLARTGLTASVEGRDVWFPRRPGFMLAPIPAAPAPAETPTDRLRQIRALAGRFKAFLDAPGGRTELRLLTRPLYRYETDGPNRPDGALFAFVAATDPEVLLLIESAPRDGAAGWNYGLARMCMLGLRAERDDLAVWTADLDPDRFAPDTPYMTRRARQVPAGDETEAAGGGK